MQKPNKRAIIALASFAIVACLAGCAPQSPSNGSAKADATGSQNAAATMDVSFSQDSDCTVCHAVESESMGDSTCLASLSSHTTMECLSCHEYGSGLEKAHEKVSPGDTPREGLRRTKVDDAVCTPCHDYAELVSKTASSTVLTDSEGTTANPHEVLATGEGHADVQCSSCHKMHKAEDTATTANNLCLSCHHAEVYECGTCH